MINKFLIKFFANTMIAILTNNCFGIMFMKSSVDYCWWFVILLKQILKSSLHYFLTLVPNDRHNNNLNFFSESRLDVKHKSRPLYVNRNIFG